MVAIFAYMLALTYNVYQWFQMVLYMDLHLNISNATSTRNSSNKTTRTSTIYFTKQYNSYMNLKCCIILYNKFKELTMIPSADALIIHGIIQFSYTSPIFLSCSPFPLYLLVFLFFFIFF